MFYQLLSYVFINVRLRHELVKKHFTPINREIGSTACPIETLKGLQQALAAEKNKHPRQPTNALIIHGNGNLKINEDPGILALNPMKLILKGAQIVHESSIAGRLDDAMRVSNKWKIPSSRLVVSGKGDSACLEEHTVSTIEEALKITAPYRDNTSGKRYHMIFSVTKSEEMPAKT